MTAQKLLEADTSRECVAVCRCFREFLGFCWGCADPAFIFTLTKLCRTLPKCWEPVPAATAPLPFLVEGFGSEFHWLLTPAPALLERRAGTAIMLQCFVVKVKFVSTPCACSCGCHLLVYQEGLFSQITL